MLKGGRVLIKVITYGTYDMLHYGHIRLLERAKALGDYLIVGVTSDDFDKSRGKINVQQSLTERVEAVRATGLADEIIIEEYEGQKIDDILKNNVDIFTVGSDWDGYFDYLKEYCKVIYLDRTQGVSSTALRSKSRSIKIGIVGNNEKRILYKYFKECEFVNGAEISAICTSDERIKKDYQNQNMKVVCDFKELLACSDAVFIMVHPTLHYKYVKEALLAGKHVLCESPIALSVKQYIELVKLADEKNLILMDSIKTAYSIAYSRLILLVKSGKIGKVVSIDATCTSLSEFQQNLINHNESWNSICAWGPTALLPIFQLLDTKYEKCEISSLFFDEEKFFDAFSKIDFQYKNSVASVKVGRGVKSDGELIISGTKGYVYVPAPWWKTDYFELRYENPADNKRYFYQLEGEGIRYELVAFLKAINFGKKDISITERVSGAICEVIEQFYKKEIRKLL